jgi:hypothetical protein
MKRGPKVLTVGTLFVLMFVKYYQEASVQVKQRFSCYILRQVAIWVRGAFDFGI